MGENKTYNILGLKGWSLVKMLKDILDSESEKSVELNTAITEYEAAYTKYREEPTRNNEMTLYDKYKFLCDILTNDNLLKEVLVNQM